MIRKPKITNRMSLSFTIQHSIRENSFNPLTSNTWLWWRHKQASIDQSGKTCSPSEWPRKRGCLVLLDISLIKDNKIPKYDGKELGKRIVLKVAILFWKNLVFLLKCYKLDEHYRGSINQNVECLQLGRSPTLKLLKPYTSLYIEQLPDCYHGFSYITSNEFIFKISQTRQHDSALLLQSITLRNTRSSFALWTSVGIFCKIKQ